MNQAVTSGFANVGGIDRIIRAVAGMAIIGAGIWFQSWWGLIGLVVLGTAIVRFCPAYFPFKLSTRGKSSDEAEAGTS